MRANGIVVSLDRGLPMVRTEAGEIRAQHTTDLLKNSKMRAVIGDFVVVEQAIGHDIAMISEILPRKRQLSRRVLVESIHEGSGKYEEQILAANIDVVFVTVALGARPLSGDYLERQLVMAHQSEAEVCLLLTKSDQAKAADADLALAAGCAPGCTILMESAVTGEGHKELLNLLGKRVGVLLGRSGVGKSTLVNELLGAPLLQTGKVRKKDHAGRHTTVARKLIELPGGGALIDAPGLRSIGLYGAKQGLASTFPEVIAAANGCRYRDCTHNGEPNCAVQAAVSRGDVAARRLASYIAIAKEVYD